MATDVLVVGGGMGGCAAALAALRRGHRVILTEETDWVGGQMTSQAVPPDEHPWIEQFGCSQSYRSLRDGIRRYYREFYPLTEAARRNPRLNPGNGCVSAICHEPKVSLAVLQGMLAPYQAGGRLTLLLEHRPAAAEASGDVVRSVTLAGHGESLTVTAPYIIDATEEGSLLPLAGVEHVTGAESQAETGEPHAPSAAQPHNMQAVSWCFVVDYRPGEHHVIDRPEQYTFWRDYVPPLCPPWGGAFLSWKASHPHTLEVVERTFDPVHPKPERGPMDLWTFRRIADVQNFQPGSYESDIVLVNWPQIDYVLGNPLEDSQHLHGARQLSLSMLYWMQTEAPRPDGGTGWPGLRLRGDITGTSDGLAKAPYIREARRIKGRFTVLEQHVGTQARAPHETAAIFEDSVGVGAYRIDLHPSTGMDNYIDVSSLPFQIPLGALLPVRVQNLLAGGKNLATTHITNGCYRLHPVEWGVGEASGLLAAWCLERKLSPATVYETAAQREAFQKMLVAEGVELQWPRLAPL
ncbi:MAG: FAD-dependent oxidoreductase [Candidatus Xenobia bacterium]